MPELACPECSKTFRTDSGLMGHLRMSHQYTIRAAHEEVSNSDWLWRCDLCKGLFSTKGSLKRHLERVEQVDPEEYLE